jgi:hypothetical protein
MLNHILGGPAYEPPAILYVVASTEAWDPAATGADCAEVDTATGYARQGFYNAPDLWAAVDPVDPVEKSNLYALTLPDVVDPYDVVSLYLADAEVDGNLLYGADLPDTLHAAVGSPGPSVPIGGWVVREDV